jgi:N-acetylglucosamine malate deacetylase 1
MKSKRKYLAVCAHPDDVEVRMGGTLTKLARAGHDIKIISLTNGNAGHYDMPPEKLAKRRKNEAAQAAALIGLSDYQIWHVPDGHLEVNLHNREKLIKAIREFAPDILFTFRTWDYHPDHRAAAQLAQDASYLVTVPGYLPEYPAPPKAPVILLTYDEFSNPCSFKPEIAVITDEVIETKIKLLACHESQFFEWLPYDRASLDDVPGEEQKRLEWLKETWLEKDQRQACKFSDLIQRRYGNDAKKCTYAETFELSEYGRLPKKGELSELLPL